MDRFPSRFGWRDAQLFPKDVFNANSADNTSGPIKVWNGTAFVLKPVKWWDGRRYYVKPIKYWNGTAWKTYAPPAPSFGVFGNVSTSPTGNQNSSADRTWLSRFNMPDTGDVTKMTFQRYTGSASDNIKAVIYGGGSASVPGGLIAVSAGTAVGAGTSGGVDVAIAASLSPGWYWLGVVSESFSSVLGTTSGSNNEILYNGSTPYAKPPGTLPATIDGTYNATMCVNATYTTGGGGGGADVVQTSRVNTTNDPEITVNIPAGVVAGSVVLIAIACNDNSTITWPAGFTTLKTATEAANLGVRLVVGSKVASGAESGTYYITSSNYVTLSAIVAVVNHSSGIDDSNAYGYYAGYGTNYSLTGASVTSTQANDLCLWFEVAVFASPTTTITPPTGFIEDKKTYQSSDLMLGLFHQNVAAVGAMTISGSAVAPSGDTHSSCNVTVLLKSH